MSSSNDESREESSKDAGLTIWQLMGSALAAASGVQSSKNRQRDFSKGKPHQFVIIGVVLTALFVLAMITLVNLVLASVS